MIEENTTPIEEQTTTTNTTTLDEQTPTTSPEEQTTTTIPDEQQAHISPLDEQLQEKRGQLTQAQITQTNAYSDYMKVMKAKTIVDKKDTEKVAKLDKLMYEHFITYQHALEEAQKLQVELSELESQSFLEELLA